MDPNSNNNTNTTPPPSDNANPPAPSTEVLQVEPQQTQVDPSSEPTSSQTPLAESHSNSTTLPENKNHKSILWIIILLIFSFLCGLFLATWYFQVKLS